MCQQMLIILSVGPLQPEIIGLPSYKSRFVDFSEGIEFRYSRRIWCLRQPFFSHVIDKGVFIFKVWDRVTFLISLSLSWISYINLAASYKLSTKPSKAIYKSSSFIFHNHFS